ncbi:MAG: LamG domain-containing protein [Armatimonadota bacterium]
MRTGSECSIGPLKRQREGGRRSGDVFGLLTDPQGNWVGRVATAAGQAAVTTPVEGGWHHLALGYDGATVRLFVDGAAAAETELAGALVSEPQTPLVVGAYSNLSGWVEGGVACVQVFKRALSAEELAGAWAAWPSSGPTLSFLSIMTLTLDAPATLKELPERLPVVPLTARTRRCLKAAPGRPTPAARG